mgnify:CR=1 FL=1
MSRDIFAPFADGNALEKHAWTEGAFFLGETASEVHGGTPFEVGMHDDRGFFVAASARGGKSTSLVINNLIDWPGGCFCLDVKGELASITALSRGREAYAYGTGTSVRSFLGQDVAVLDPKSVVRGPARAVCTRYNPVRDLDPSDPGYVTAIRRLAAAIVVPDNASTGQHFSDVAQHIVEALLDYLVVCEARELPATGRALPSLHAIVSEMAQEPDNEDEPDPLIGRLKPYRGRTLIGDALGALQVVGDREFGSIFSTVTRQLRWLGDPEMQDQLSADADLSLRALVRDEGTVYVCLPPDEMEDHKRWLRVLLTMALQTKIREGAVVQTGHQMLFMLDEFPALGYMPLMQQVMSQLPGYGIKAVPIVQTIGQLKTLYGEAHTTFLGNTAGQIFFSLNDPDTAKYASEWLGQQEFIEESSSQSENVNTPQWRGSWLSRFLEAEEARKHEKRGGWGESASVSHSRKVEAIMRPEEIRRHTSRGKDRMLVVTADGAPLFVRRVPFFERFSTDFYESQETIMWAEAVA